MAESFWSDRAVEPKRSHKWILRINSIPQWVVKTTGKPKFAINETAHQYLNHEFYFPGRLIWEPISVTLVDPVVPDAGKTVLNIIEASGYVYPRDRYNVTTISKEKAVNALAGMELVQLGTRDEAVEIWGFTNAWIRNVDFGDLDYSSEEMANVTLEIRFDFAYRKDQTPAYL